MIKSIRIVFIVIILLSNTLLLFSQNETKISEQISLSDEDVNLFKEKSQQKIDEFLNYVIIIGDKEQPVSKRDMAEREAIKLFYEGSIMETSSIKKDGSVKIRQRPMAEYLYRLKTLPYLKVVIEFYDICYVDEFTRGPDGKYYGAATVFQKFTGFNGENIAYEDITKKEISIIIDIIEDEFYNERRWAVFLGDIKASETRNK